MEKQEESVNLIEEKIKELIMLLQTNQHMKDKVVAQAAWDKYLKLLRFLHLMTLRFQHQIKTPFFHQ